MTGREGIGEFRRFVEADLLREDLYFSARTATLIGVVILVAGLIFGIEFLLSGIIMVGVGLVLFVFLMDDYLQWRSYQRKIASSAVSGL